MAQLNSPRARGGPSTHGAPHQRHTLAIRGLLSRASASTAQRALKQLPATCTVPNCQTCAPGSTTQCGTCMQGYIKTATNLCNICTTAWQTRTQCATFTANSCTCTACNPNFGPQPISGQCRACVPPSNCTSLQTPQNVCNGCAKCATNYGITDLKTCTACSVASCQAYNENTCICKTCSPNFNLTGNTCAACAMPACCATPLANKCQGCSVCQKGYMPTGPATNRQCSACTGGQALGTCTAYNSTGTSCVCTECADGWRLEQGTCVQCSPVANCDDYARNSCACATCKANFSGPSCTECQPPAYCDKAMTNRCQGCSVCLAGFLPTGTTRQCTACMGGQAPTVCNAYTNNGTSCTCATCANRYQLTNGNCAACTNNPNCDKFRPNSCTCATCKPGHTGQNCSPCSNPANCDKFMADKCQGCSVCLSGYALTNRQCAQCTGGQASSPAGPCTAYNSTGTSCVCTACANGHRLDSGKGTCVKCTSNSFCKDFKDNTCGCDTCNTGYRLSGPTFDTCALCSRPANCNTTMENVCDGCSVCQRGFMPTGPATNRQCSECTGGQARTVCMDYVSTGTSCECKACADGYRLEQGTCVKCPTIANCTDYAPNACSCDRCTSGYRGPNCDKCSEPPFCTQKQTNVCDGCAVCQKGRAPVLTGDNRGQCAACTGGQATEVCNAYKNLGTSCECATCVNRYQPVQGSCVECTSNPQCEQFLTNSCNCETCKTGHKGFNCAECLAPTNCTEPMANKCDGCSVCESGFAPAPATRQCLACTGGQALGTCTAYSNAGTSCVCTACADGWRLDKGTCVKCPLNSNCDIYTPNTCECTRCKPDFRGSACEPCRKPANCTTEMDDRCQGCSECQAGFALSSGQCAACTGGQARELCNAYVKPNGCECKECANGYRLEDGACVECKMLNPNCEEFKPNSCECAKCEAGYSGDDCTLCTVPDSCVTALEDACQGCEVCHSGYALTNRQCTQCTGGQSPDACVEYADPGTKCECTTCHERWQLQQGACTECAADPTCAAFKANSCDCDTCESGFKSAGDKCEKCPDPERCATAAANVCDGCDICKTGHSLDDATRQCTPCADGQAPDVCTAYAADNSCECMQCSSGWQLTGATCQPCEDVPNCQAYADSSCDCEQCFPGYVGSKCEACHSGYERQGDACQPCSAAGCDTFADGSCTCAVCLSGHMMDESGACQQCPQNDACQAYEPNSCNCVSCISGTAGPLCTPCNMDNCAAFEDGSCLCTECYPGNQLMPWKQCIACPPSPKCTERLANSCDCSTCEPGYVSPRCTPECDNGHSKGEEGCSECTGNPGCEMYEDNTCTCSQCMAGFFKNPDTGLCEECNPRPDCTALVPNTCECQLCQLDNCDAPLEGCSGCSQCTSGYTLPAGSTTCEKCQTPASNCDKFKPNSCTECDTCASGYTRDEATGACEQAPTPPCLNGFYPNPDGSPGCTACEPAQPACDVFEPNTCVCSKCKKAGFAAPNCLTCGLGWQPKDENSCEPCPAIEHCKSYDSKCACDTCDAGYSGPACQPEAAGQCATKPPGCAVAEAGNCERCSICANTHQKDWEAGTCSPCEANSRCETRYENYCYCAKCQDGYAGFMCEMCNYGWGPNSNGSCELCQANLPGCDLLVFGRCDRCEWCQNKHMRNSESGACVQCDDNPRCQRTEWNSCACAECAAGYTGQNCDSCANGWRPINGACEQCPKISNCLRYDESCACTSCAPFFSGPTCVAEQCQQPERCYQPADWRNYCSGCYRCAPGYFVNSAKQCEACEQAPPPGCLLHDLKSCGRCFNWPGTCEDPWDVNPETGACDQCRAPLRPTGDGNCGDWWTGRCEATIDDCRNYDENCSCKRCHHGFALDADGRCTTCPYRFQWQWSATGVFFCNAYAHNSCDCEELLYFCSDGGYHLNTPCP